MFIVFYQNESESYTKIETLTSSHLFTGSLSVVLTLGLEKWNPYLKLGLLTYAGSIIAQGNTQHEYFSPNLYDEEYSEVYKRKYSGMFGLGATASLGVSYSITDNILLFAECNINAINCSPSKSEILQWEEHSVDIDLQNNTSEVIYTNNLEDMTYSEIHTEYVRKIKRTSVPYPSEDEAREEIKISMPFSNIGASIGVKFRF